MITGAMRPCAEPTLKVRTAEFGGPRPMICVPLVADTPAELHVQATIARDLAPDVIEWRADSFADVSATAMCEGARALRAVAGETPVIYTLRIQSEGGAKAIDQDLRQQVYRAVIDAGDVDLVDIELANGAEWVAPIVSAAHAKGVRAILSFHDFKATPSDAFLLQKIAEMVRQGADIAKAACMPTEPGDVLRLMQTTAIARQMYPSTALCTMSMGRLGVPSRVVGFAYGSDMTFAAGKASSAPGQIPIAALRGMLDGLLEYV